MTGFGFAPETPADATSLSPVDLSAVQSLLDDPHSSAEFLRRVDGYSFALIVAARHFQLIEISEPSALAVFEARYAGDGKSTYCEFIARLQYSWTLAARTLDSEHSAQVVQDPGC